MKTILVLLLAAAAMPAAEKKKPVTPAKVKAAAKPAPAPSGLPAGAKSIGGGAHSYTDAQGKKWLYRETPWGYMKLEDDREAAARIDKTVKEEPVTATEDGDLIRFEKQGPFGPYRWEKKRGELDAIEQAALQQSQERNAAKRD